MNQDVAVIIVNYRSAAQTLGAVQSVLNEGAVGELIVVDNSADAAESARLRERLPATVRLLVSAQNLGFAAACNWAWQATGREFVLLLNPDARLLPGALERLRRTLVTEPKLAAVAPATWWDGERRWLLPTLLPERMTLWLAMRAARRWPASLGRGLAQRWLRWQTRLHSAQSPQGVSYLSGAVLLLRRAAVTAAGGLFDARFFMFFEDADLSRRLTQRGFRLALEPRAEAVHAWRNAAHKAALMSMSARHYFSKHYPRLAAACKACGIEDFFGTIDRCWGRPSARLETIAATPPQMLYSEADWHAWLGEAPIALLSPSPVGFPALLRSPAATETRAEAGLWSRLDPGLYVVGILQGETLTWRSCIKVA